jgi:hypothetical protein
MKIKLADVPAAVNTETVEQLSDYVYEKSGKRMPIVVEPEQLEEFTEWLKRGKRFKFDHSFNGITNAEDDALIGLSLIDPEDLLQGFTIVFMEEGGNGNEN